MSQSTDEQIIKLHLLENWPETPVVFENEDAIDLPETFIRLTVMAVNDTRQTLGPNADYERSGLIWIDIFVPLETGTSELLRMTDTLVALYRDQTLTDETGNRVRCHNVSFRAGQSDHRHARRIINIQYSAR